MEKEMIDEFSYEILELGAKSFGVAPENLIHIGNWQNFIYEYKINGQSYILRFTPSPHRPVNKVKGEIDWLLYLSKNGVSVSNPIESKNGHFVEVIETNNTGFIVTSFTKALGRKIGYPECLNDNELYYKLGRITGRIHSLSQKYKPSDKTIQRHDWHQNYYLQNIGKFVPINQKLVHESCFNLMKTIKDSLPKDETSYGLIHGDIGVGNFLVNEEGIITLFDFDEAQYSWFVEDIAVQLYYLVYVYGGEEGKNNREAQAYRFMEYFLKGYEREHSIDEYWLKQIPLFLKLREIIVYIGCNRSWDMTNLNQWSKDYLTESKERIEKGEPVVDIWK
ncbi:phosphotransferase [Bacillus sp. FJAT-49732]|uniref:Phosphotransferase n=1 Tax=Lederbergia citrisecunda TaxID=2833583 RepID=A0A942YL43_9BACI|nr:phosphotransferase [Lederbergia citrisecunda]MBS4199969.1 phosphotransferase [Lederbergia citrisecunda]